MNCKDTLTMLDPEAGKWMLTGSVPDKLYNRRDGARAWNKGLQLFPGRSPCEFQNKKDKNSCKTKPF